ncbi:MAG: RidA family protein [Balneolaceae bacterium]
MDLTKQKTSRRSMIKSMFATMVASGAGMLGIAQAKPADPVQSGTGSNGEILKYPVRNQQDEIPLYSRVTVHNGLVYIAGTGEHSDGDAADHTVAILDKIEEALLEVGSSMDKVLKANVYLHDLNDYGVMNDAYRGRFGENPPVRTTVGNYGGIPGRSLVEIDCIAAL